MKDLEFLHLTYENRYTEVDLPVYIVETQEDWENFNGKYASKFMPTIIDTVKHALDEDFLEVPVFKVLFINTGQSATAVCKRDFFDEALRMSILYFEETEEFEKCRTALNMIEDEG
jgi:hypothetical protein